jgi:hypothetical protein
MKVGMGALACVLALGLGLSFAQGTADREALIDKELSETAGLDMESIRKIPADKKLSNVKEMLASITSRRQAVQDKYDKLKQDPESSAQRIDCVNKKLLVIKSLTLGAENSATKMNTALNPPAGESRDEQAAANYYSLVVIADTRSKQEAQNANLCTGGESLSSVNEGANSTYQAEGIPEGFTPVAEGGRLSIEDLFEGVVQFENFPNLTPLS